MRQIKIVADSSSDVMEMEGVAYACAPLKINTAEREFTDDRRLNVDEMVEYLYNYKGQSKSSCPNVSDWLDAFGDADDILCVTITSGLSGSYNSACMAKDIYEREHEGRRVFVLDSLTTGPEMKLVMEKMQECISQGLPFDEICACIVEYLKMTGLMFMLKSLKNFANNGRVSPAVAKIAGFMGICIVGRASDEGTLELSHKCRGELRSLETILADLEKFGLKEGKVRIAHCQNEEAALKLKDMILDKFEKAKVEIHKLRGLCSFYAEKGGVLVGFEKM